MEMEKFKHFSHECDLTSPELDTNSICNICHKEGSVEYACKSCTFELCISCSKLPWKVSHDFHPEHPLEFCSFKYDRRPTYIICSGCGNMSSGSFYKCKSCEIYLDLGCALLNNIVDAWNIDEMLHDCHAHLLKRCRPGPDAEGSCLLCELPVSPSSISYGCVHCYSFIHHKCIDLPKEIQHPVHPAHPLRRLSYVRTLPRGDTKCNACTLKIPGVPYSCIECGIDLHLRCADSLLRGLMHKSHEHRLSYVATGARFVITKQTPCQICMRTKKMSLDSYYQCVECDLKFHFKCLEIPESLVKKSFHTHPLVCKIFLGEDKSFEYCGVCETMVTAGHHTYCCEDCDFLGHIECILREEEPSPLYLKDLYLCGDEDVTGATNREDHETNNIETKLMVDDVSHIHVMKPIDMSEINNPATCDICKQEIFGSSCKCTSCIFQAHHFCIELGLPSSTLLLHRNHPLTLLPSPPTEILTSCDQCKMYISGFNLFCRICNFIIDITCALKSRHSLGILGKKVIEECEEKCISDKHNMVQVIVSRSLLTSCAVCFEKLYGKALSCMTCGDVYHLHCIDFWKKSIFDHPLHSDHWLTIRVRRGAECIACKMNILEYGYGCYICDISFHIECIKAVNLSGKIKSHIHYFYNFWMDDLESNQLCNVCARPCPPSFYGCVDCKFKAHVECVGTAKNLKSHRHQHSVEHKQVYKSERCSLCGLECIGHIYSCNHCSDVFHIRCLMPMDHRKAATKEEQVCDIYLVYIERDLYDICKS